MKATLISINVLLSLFCLAGSENEDSLGFTFLMFVWCLCSIALFVYASKKGWLDGVKEFCGRIECEEECECEE